MIANPTVNEWFAALTEIAPSLANVLEDARAYWDPEPIPSVLTAADLANALIPQLNDLDADSRSALTVIIESGLLSEHQETGEVVATGFLEAVVNALERDQCGREAMDILGPEARAYCRAWDQFTGARTPFLYEEE